MTGPACQTMTKDSQKKRLTFESEYGLMALSAWGLKRTCCSVYRFFVQSPFVYYCTPRIGGGKKTHITVKVFVLVHFGPLDEVHFVQKAALY